jgi:hypothetical protein
MDWFEKCVEKMGDPQFCSLVDQTGELVSVVVDCVKERKARDCFEECLKTCQGDRCEETCLGALEVALGALTARGLAEKAALIAALLGFSPIDALATVFSAELRKTEEGDCPDKAFSARVLVTAASHLYLAFRNVPALRDSAQDVLILMAPAFAAAYQCIGDVVFDHLEMMRPFIGEDAAERIVAALEEGGVMVGNVIINFKPVKAKQ